MVDLLRHSVISCLSKPHYSNFWFCKMMWKFRRRYFNQVHRIGPYAALLSIPRISKDQTRFNSVALNYSPLFYEKAADPTCPLGPRTDEPYGLDRRGRREPINTMSKRNRLRKLRTQKQSKTRGTIMRAILLCCLIGIIHYMLVYHPEILLNFVKNYHEQYNLLVHGRVDYCSENVGNHDLITIIRPQILHQDEALNKLETIFRNHTQFTSIAIIGTTGVGKTLFSNLFMKHFPWQDNVQHFSWSTFADQHEKDVMENKLLKRLSSCGHNLIVIDDLVPKDDAAYIGSFNKKAEQMAVDSTNRLILVYIFNIVSFLERAENAYGRVSGQLKQLEGIQAVPFRSFDQSHLSACIKYEAELLNVSLNAEKISEIQNSIEAAHSGCKGVYAKVVVFSEAA